MPSEMDLSIPISTVSSPKKFVVSNLLVTDSIIAKFLDQQVLVNIIYFNFSKAFDRVSYSLFVHVVHSLRICDTFLV